MHHYHVLDEIPFSEMDPATLTTNVQRMATATTGSVNDDPYINEELADVYKYSEMAQHYPARFQANPFTVKLDTFDGNRKNNFSGLILILNGYSRITVELAKRDAALYLLQQIGNYSNIRKSNYSNAAGEFKKFFDKLSEPKTVEALNTIGIKAIFDGIIAGNDNFEGVYDQKVSTAPETPELSIIDVKKAIIEHITSVLKYVDSKANRKESRFVEAAVKINEIVADFQKVYKADITRNENSAAAAKKLF